MEEKDILEKSIETRKAEIEDFKTQHELFLQSLNEDQLTDYLVNMYSDNEEKIKKFNFETISEDDAK